MNKKFLEKAIHFARDAHVGQTYSEVYSYVRHLEHVYEVLIRFGYEDDENLLISAWLHDTIEDTPVTYQDIKREFNIEIAEIVYAVTDELGRNRKERKKKTYPKIKENPKATIIKLADRIANIEFSVKGVFGNPSKLKMYQKEHEEFKLKLKRCYSAYRSEDDIKMDKMWKYLDKLLDYKGS